jgi:hypothetical protein
MAPSVSAPQDADVATYWDRYSNRILGGSVVFVLLVGTLTYSAIEGWSLVDSFYFSSVALTVVGFGDLTPSSDLSKIFTVFYIFSGIAIVALWIQVRTKHRIVKRAQKKGSDSGAVASVESAPLSAAEPMVPPGETVPPAATE